jgi:multisubunit Na+/H+ antiporter MnhC subunit
MDIESCTLRPGRLAALIRMIDAGEISGKIAKTVFEEMYSTQEEPAEVVRRLGLVQISDESALAAVIDRVKSANPKQLAEYRAGKEKLFGYFAGQVILEYLALFSLLRFVVEFFRDDERGFVLYGLLSTSQLIAILIILTKRNLVKILLGINILESAANLLIISIGYREGGGAPIFTLTPSMTMVLPTPQALVLTSIVIGVATSALLLSFTMVIYRKYGSVDVNDMKENVRLVDLLEGCLEGGDQLVGKLVEESNGIALRNSDFPGISLVQSGHDAQ